MRSGIIVQIIATGQAEAKAWPACVGRMLYCAERRLGRPRRGV